MPARSLCLHFGLTGFCRPPRAPSTPRNSSVEAAVAGAELVPPLRVDRVLQATLATVPTGAIIGDVAERVDVQILEQGADKADVQVAHGAKLTRVRSLEVEAPGMDSADVDVGVGNEAARGPKRGVVRVTVDHRAEERITGLDALVDDRIEPDRSDR